MPTPDDPAALVGLPAEDDVSAALRQAAAAAEATAAEMRDMADRYAPRTLGAAVARLEGTKDALQMAMAELREATDGRERALRHALRYRRQARHARELATLATHYSEANAVDAVAALERVAALEAAIEEALKRDGAGCRDWREPLEGVRRA